MRSTIVDVDLDAIAANATALRKAANAELIAVVKADAYGHGALPVARTVLEAGAAMLAVATIDEGVQLRNAGIQAPILVLLGPSDMDDAQIAHFYRLACAVWDLDRATLLSRAAAKERPAIVHFKVDTGLTRLGSPLAEAGERLATIRALPNLRVDGLFTHYATADDPDDSFAREQLARFESFVRTVKDPPQWIHAAASAGVAALGAQPVCNAIRPGLALYGLAPAQHLADRVPLRAALSWRSAVHRIVNAPAGTGVSYGHEFRLPRPGRIATVPVGYGDGLSRKAQGAKLLVRGQRLPIVGRVCMDLVMLDASDTQVEAGDEVVIIGEQQGARRTADDLAAECGTISYEVVTGIRDRVPKRYLRGGQVVAWKTLAGGYSPS